VTVEGLVQPGWEAVADAFERVVTRDEGAGSAVCVYADGRPVVDLWGGDTGTGRPWGRTTTACVFSATKGVAALCVHLLVQRGLLALDVPVARYWPEFADGGKEGLLVRWLLTHQAGLPMLEPSFTLDEVLAVEPVLRAIEVQRPLWEPGTQHGYHALTYGFLVGELVRRVTGRTLGRFFDEEFARPLTLNAWIGLPARAEVDVAALERASGEPNLLETLIAADPDGPLGQVAKVLTLGGALPLQLVGGGHGDFNDRRVLAAELPAANLVSDARSLARTYAATVSEVDGVRLLDDATAEACVPVQTADTPVFGTPAGAPRTLDFGLGFLSRPLLGESCFGHPGASGALGFADTGRRLAFGFVPRLMRAEDQDARPATLLAAVREVLA
jgi:CubicO group peptidase (beta-lactamase class C family)